MPGCSLTPADALNALVAAAMPVEDPFSYGEHTGGSCKECGEFSWNADKHRDGCKWVATMQTIQDAVAVLGPVVGVDLVDAEWRRRFGLPWQEGD